MKFFHDCIDLWMSPDYNLWLCIFMSKSPFWSWFLQSHYFQTKYKIKVEHQRKVQAVAVNPIHRLNLPSLTVLFHHHEYYGFDRNLAKGILFRTSEKKQYCQSRVSWHAGCSKVPCDLQQDDEILSEVAISISINNQ